MAALTTDATADAAPEASIVIVTRNRREKVRAAIASALVQAGGPEVVIIDDGSTDGTAAAIRAEFPAVRVVAHAERRGYVVRRTQGGRVARGRVLFSIDDDATYADPAVIADTLAALDADGRVGAVMIPHVNRSADGGAAWSAPLAPAAGGPYVTGSFIGTAYGVRRDVFNDLGGFRDCLFHWDEEADFCQRLLGAGLLVLMGSRHRIDHHPGWSGKYDRDTLEHIYRNRILTVGFNAPAPLLAPLLAAQLLRAARATADRGSRSVAIAGTRRGVHDLALLWTAQRRPIPLAAYRLWLRLRNGRHLPLAQAAAALCSHCRQ